MSMTIGGARVALIESRNGSMEMGGFPDRLSLILCLIDSGGFDLSYGDEKHIAALARIESEIAAVRLRIEEHNKEPDPEPIEDED
jgi:hypothetical protein